MLKKRISRAGSVLLAGIVGALLVVAPAAPSTRGEAKVAAAKLTIWSDQDRKAAVDKVAGAGTAIIRAMTATARMSHTAARPRLPRRTTRPPELFSGRARGRITSSS